ncbi:methyltransferase domain-containing protein [Aeoliella sp. ICT_H6.2]|uniref:Methyltransferase domain-containing protein n=1 Tax=Aeoliella straminimaris TaxID=2954799 RepID=A0A9X2FF47_9BACT|nr:class I SAM-dependent methyltransferase [Aeoliella straminimaris]MCO6047559.1 methyltransferase domain-containing protein [Aeoliella straminimaris]
MLPFDSETLSNYFRLMNAHALAQTYRGALHSGLADALAGQPATIDQLCDACQLQPRGTEIVLDVLQAAGLVVRDGELFRASPLLEILLSGHYRELGDQYWRHLPQLLATGEPMAAMDSVADSEEHYQTQAMALGWMMVPAAQRAAAILSRECPLNDAQVLDVGAGSAVWSLALAKVNASLRVTAVDWPAVLQVAQQFAVFAGVEDRLTCVAGNFHEVDLPTSTYQLAIVANVSHLESAENVTRLLSRVRAALLPGGHVAIVDALAESPDQDRVAHGLYRLGLALRTVEARVHRQEELRAMLADSGYCDTEYYPLAAPPHMVGMLLARAPT